MLLNQKIKLILSLIIISAFLGIYQGSLIEKKLINFNILVPFSPQIALIHQSIENTKISLKSSLQKQFLFADTLNLKASININSATPEIQHQQPSPLPKNCREAGCVVLLIGDSVMGDIYFSMNRKIKKSYPDWRVVDAHKVSTGLSNVGYYNWPETLEKLLSTNHPDYILIMLGMNDGQSIVENKKAYRFATPEWVDIYRERGTNLLNIAKSTPATVYWLEVPQTLNTSLNKKIEIIRDIHKEVASNNFLTTNDKIEQLLSQKVEKVYQKDGTHLNVVASDFIADEILKKLITH